VILHRRKSVDERFGDLAFIENEANCLIAKI